MLPTYIDHILVLLLGLALPFFSGIRGSEKLGQIYFDERIRRRFFISNSLVLWFMAAVVMGIWYWNKRPFELMGFRAPEPGLAAALLAGVLVILYTADVMYSVLSPQELAKTQEQWESAHSEEVIHLAGPESSNRILDQMVTHSMEGKCFLR